MLGLIPARVILRTGNHFQEKMFRMDDEWATSSILAALGQEHYNRIAW